MMRDRSGVEHCLSCEDTREIPDPRAGAAPASGAAPSPLRTASQVVAVDLGSSASSTDSGDGEENITSTRRALLLEAQATAAQAQGVTSPGPATMDIVPDTPDVTSTRMVAPMSVGAAARHAMLQSPGIRDAAEAFPSTLTLRGQSQMPPAAAPAVPAGTALRTQAVAEHAVQEAGSPLRVPGAAAPAEAEEGSDPQVQAILMQTK